MDSLEEVRENNSESKAFQKHFSDLYESAVANPVLLCVKLYSADVISQEMKRKFSDMTVREDQALELLNASERMIKLDPKKFYSFVTELKKIDEPLGKKLLNTCAQLNSTNTEFEEQSHGPSQSASLQSTSSSLQPVSSLPSTSGRSSNDDVLSCTATTEEEKEEERDGTRRRVSCRQSNDSLNVIEGSKMRSTSKKRPKLDRPVKVIDTGVYIPSEWVTVTRPCQSPYLPQVGDVVVYCHQGHEIYCEAVLENKVYSLEDECKPWKKYNLQPQEICKVKKVEFFVVPPTLCSAKLREPSTLCSITLKVARKIPVQFSIKFHDMESVPDFIILKDVYDRSRRIWSPGEMFKCFINNCYYYGEVVKCKPFSKDLPNSLWQNCYVKWDDNGEDSRYLSPWDMQTLDCEMNNEALFEDGEEERERILYGLETILKDDGNGLVVAKEFLQPVDFVKESKYCKAVAYPTSLSTIIEKLKNKFYRRKAAVLWEVNLLSRNAHAYNEDGSDIVINSNIVVQMLTNFIRDTKCTDPRDYYNQEDILNLTPESISDAVQHASADESTWNPNDMLVDSAGEYLEDEEEMEEGQLEGSMTSRNMVVTRSASKKKCPDKNVNKKKQDKEEKKVRTNKGLASPTKKRSQEKRKSVDNGDEMKMETSKRKYFKSEKPEM